MSKWFAYVRYAQPHVGSILVTPPMMALFVLPCTVDNPSVPEGGGQRLKVVGDRKAVIDDAIAYLQVERMVEETELIKRSTGGG